jgi:hypothetical protein
MVQTLFQDSTLLSRLQPIQKTPTVEPTTDSESTSSTLTSTSSEEQKLQIA